MPGTYAAKHAWKTRASASSLAAIRVSHSTTSWARLNGFEAAAAEASDAAGEGEPPSAGDGDAGAAAGDPAGVVLGISAGSCSATAFATSRFQQRRTELQYSACSSSSTVGGGPPIEFSRTRCSCNPRAAASIRRPSFHSSPPPPPSPSWKPSRAGEPSIRAASGERPMTGEAATPPVSGGVAGLGHHPNDHDRAGASTSEAHAPRRRRPRRRRYRRRLVWPRRSPARRRRRRRRRATLITAAGAGAQIGGAEAERSGRASGDASGRWRAPPPPHRATLQAPPPPWRAPGRRRMSHARVGPPPRRRGRRGCPALLKGLMSPFAVPPSPSPSPSPPPLTSPGSPAVAASGGDASTGQSPRWVGVRSRSGGGIRFGGSGECAPRPEERRWTSGGGRRGASVGSNAAAGAAAGDGRRARRRGGRR